jgi:glutamate-1-semialdehyde 2,1-aminomutase
MTPSGVERAPSSVERAASSIHQQFSRRAHELIPGGAHTYSKGDDQLPVNAPAGFVRGRGARVWDLEGREFVDWGMGISSVLIGHAEPAIDDAAIAALRDGQNLSRPTPLEPDTAEALLALFPGMEMCKFAKHGSDANSAAIRLARAITGRPLIAYDRAAPFFSIHDWFIGTTAIPAGVPEEIRRLSVPFAYNDLASLEQAFAEHPRRIAAVILEAARDVAPAAGFLEGVRRLCDREGALLILDEVITGFRYGLHGAQGRFGVVPDFTSLGKGLANGYSVSALLGKRAFMERGGLLHDQERVFLLSTTNGAERSGLAAALATIRFYQTEGVVERLEAVGRAVMDGINHAAARHGIAASVVARSAFGCRPMVQCLAPDGTPSAPLRTLFLQETLAAGVFMPWLCPSFRHGPEELARTLEAVDRACAAVARAVEQGSTDGLLEGRPVKPVFRRYN